MGHCFERNAGQVLDDEGHARPDVHFVHVAEAYSVILTSGGFSYQFQNISESDDPMGEIGFRLKYHRIDVTFEGANPCPTISSTSPLFRNTHYSENGKKFMSEVMDTVIYHQVFEGVDIRFVSKGKTFKYDIICKDNDALSRVQLKFSGPLGPMSVSDMGELAYTTNFGTVMERIPLSFLKKGDIQKSVEVLPILSEDGVSIAFRMTDTWPEGHQLVIDPLPHLLWSTYVGGSGMDELRQVELDDEGNIYVSGFTTSLNTIATSGAYQGTLIGFQNCFLHKYSPQGQKLFGTYFGGQSADRCYGMTRDYTTGDIYLSGSSFSAGMATEGTHQQALASPDDGLLAKFASNGNLLWATYFGGNEHDFIAQLDVDIQGNLLMTGHTKSTNGISTDLTFLPGNENAFIAKFSPDGYQLWGTYLGGTFDEGWGIGSDASGNIFVSGETSGISGIGTPDTHQPNNGGGLDAFLVKYSPFAQQLWGTYLGGTGSDRSTSLEVCADGSVVVVGNTESPNGIASFSGYQTQPASVDDGFLARFSTDGQRAWGTYVGGEGVDYLTTVQETTDGELLIAGRSESFFQVTTPDAYQIQPAGEYDALVMRFSVDGGLQWGTYIGGPSTEFANNLAYDSNSGHVVIAGMTKSTEGIATLNAEVQDYSGGLYDGFLARFCIPPSPTVIAQLGTLVCGSGPLPFQLDEGGLTVHWNNGATGPQLTFFPPDVGQLTVFAEVIDAFGCPGVSDTVMVSAFEAFQPQFSIVMDPSNELCIGVTAQLSLSASFDEVLWWDGSDMPIANYTVESETPQWLGVTVFNSDECAVADSVLVVPQLCTSADEPGDYVYLSVYPNPNSGSITLKWPGHEGEKMIVTIHSMEGRTVFQTLHAIGLPLQLPLVAGSYLVKCGSLSNQSFHHAQLLLIGI